VNKRIFLKTLSCPRGGWFSRRGLLGAELSGAQRFQMEQGREVEAVAHRRFPGAVMVQDRGMAPAAARTQRLLADPAVPAVLEAAFLVDGYAVRADVLERTEEGWRLWEIKSGTSPRPAYTDDLAYTLMVLRRAGLEPAQAGLLYVSRDFRLGMDPQRLIAQADCSERAEERAAAFDGRWEIIDRISGADEPLEPELLGDCRGCDLFSSRCLGRGVEHSVFELPSLTGRRRVELLERGIVDIAELPAELELSARQELVRSAVLDGEDRVLQGLETRLAELVWPALYLDFESVGTAIPLYAGQAPYQQVPTQYSVHSCTAPGQVVDHRAFLAEDPSQDPRRELALRLLRDLQGEGSIVVYSSFEKQIIQGLARALPDLASGLRAVLGRLYDLERVIRKGYVHPDFRGRSSIKVTLPVMVPELDYGDLQVADGRAAMAAFAHMARGQVVGPEALVLRQQLLDYCERDTLAMVRLHQALVERIQSE